MQEGAFREDLLARINLWSFRLPGLAERREDIEPNLEFELERLSVSGRKVNFNQEARQAFLAFALAPEATWSANFRDLGAAITRMATLAQGGRITRGDVAAEIARLKKHWGTDRTTKTSGGRPGVIPREQWEELDLFDQVQLAEVVRICRETSSLSAAGRRLFAQSRQGKKIPNDADRLRKYLARFGLRWQQVAANPAED